MLTHFIFILTPFLFLIHDLEEIFTQKYWMKANAERIMTRFPKLHVIVMALKEISIAGFCVIVIEEFLLLSVATILFMYGYKQLLFLLFWGFSLHLIIHIIQAVALKSYVPGVVTSICMIPVVIIGVRSMILHFSVIENTALAVSGLALVALNLLLMHWIVRRKKRCSP